MHNLIITEKPSVARTISKVLGATARRDGYLEGGGYLISWCVGHLVELAPPGVYDPRLERWDRADLPILPEKWQYLVSSSTKKQFDVLCKLMHRADVDRIVCATDAGREGELIFRLVYHQCGCRKPVSRLWISSMEDAAIRAGFANLKPSTEYDSLYKAALCRERADWLVGINATRLFSCLHGVTLNVGRVMTPTLAMTVEREAAIDPSGLNLSTRYFSRWRTAWRPANDSKTRPRRRSCWQNAGKAARPLCKRASAERNPSAHRPSMT